MVAQWKSLLKRLATPIAASAVLVGSIAIAGPVSPSTAAVDVQLKDWMVLSDIAATNGANAELSAQGNALWTTKAGLEDFADSYRLDLQVNSSAIINGSGISGSDTTTDPITSFSGFPSGGYSTTSSLGSGGTYAYGSSSIPQFDNMNAASHTSSDSTNSSIATANAYSSVLQISLKSAAEIAAMNGGSSTFTAQLFMDVTQAAINLFTDTVNGSLARGQFTLTATALGYDADGNIALVDVSQYNKLQVVSNGGTFSQDYADSTAPDLSNPFIAFDVDASTIRSLTINFGLTTMAQTISAVPEPSAMLLSCMGIAGAGIARWKRRRTQPTT